MAIVIVAPNRDVSGWKKIISEKSPDVKVYVWPDCDQNEEVDCAIVWNHPSGSLKEFPNLKFVSSMGAGVDHILRDTTIDDSIKITRITDDGITLPMTNYVLMAVLNYHKQFFKYQEDKKNKVWDQQLNPEIDLSIGILGLGVLGKDVAEKLQMLGFKVLGFSNSRKNIKGVKSYAGEEELDEFLSQVNTLVCMLPLTSQTKNSLNMNFFRRMKKGSIFINVARGAHLVEEDLLKAMEEGIISSAFLDVFQTEPLPQDHPFWEHPDIHITPHIASVTNPVAAIPQVLENYKLLKEGKPLNNEIDKNKGY